MRYYSKRQNCCHQHAITCQFQAHFHSDHIDKMMSLLWLKDGRLKGYTESEVFAIQDQAVKTKYIEKHIYRTREDYKCRLCNEYKETLHHIMSGCPNVT